jgi:hypothetical protein
VVSRTAFVGSLFAAQKDLDRATVKNAIPLKKLQVRAASPGRVRWHVLAGRDGGCVLRVWHSGVEVVGVGGLVREGRVLSYMDGGLGSIVSGFGFRV